MKKFARRLQQLGEKAAQVQRAIDAAPARAAQIRETVMATAGQVQQLRAEVMSAVSTLRSTDESRHVDSIRELGQGRALLAEAGLELEMVELEMGLNQRLVVQLARVAVVPSARLRGLRDSAWERPAIQAILGALLTAQELADQVDGGGLTFTRLTAYIGSSPVVRIAWEPEEEAEEEPGQMPAVPPVIPSTASATAVPTSVSVPASAPASAEDGFGEGSFFGRPRAGAVPATSPRVPAAGPTAAAAQVPSGPAEGSTAGAAGSGDTPAVDWRRDALARFKKMPDLTREAGRRPGGR